MPVSPELNAAATVVADAKNADLIVYSGGIYEPGDTDLRKKILASKSRKNAYLLLTTDGGNPDVGYRIVSAIRDAYEGGEFWLIVNGRCKSAGTLIAVGAHLIIM